MIPPGSIRKLILDYVCDDLNSLKKIIISALAKNLES